MNKLTDAFVLSNGVKIPCIGYGTWQTPDGETAVKAVKSAIENGYRHIDGAAVYENETSVGEGIKESGIDRKELFVTSKVWNNNRGYEKTIKACEKSLKDFGLDYFDLYLIHWPANPKTNPDDWNEVNLDTWRGMIDLYKAGKVKAIGVSNFKVEQLKPLMETEVKPMVDQIENHPGFWQPEIIKYCQKNGIVVEAWSPMGSGAVLSNEIMKKLAEKYGKTVAHMCIRWNLQKNVLPLPKSVTPSRIADNTKVFDFTISDEDMKMIDAIENVGYSGNNPETFDVM